MRAITLEGGDDASVLGEEWDSASLMLPVFRKYACKQSLDSRGVTLPPEDSSVPPCAAMSALNVVVDSCPELVGAAGGLRGSTPACWACQAGSHATGSNPSCAGRPISAGGVRPTKQKQQGGGSCKKVGRLAISRCTQVESAYNLHPNGGGSSLYITYILPNPC